MTLLGGHHKTAEQQYEVREARRLLKERVRNDWDYPPLPAYQRAARRPQPARRKTDDHARVAGFKFHAPKKDGSNPRAGLETEALEWRERVDSSGSESDVASRANSSKSSLKSKRSDYMFEGPDSVGSQIQDRRTARKRKRQTALEQQLSWNEGLKHWTSQRDAWAGATPSAQIKNRQEHSTQEAELSAGSDTSAESTPRTSTSSTAAEVASAATTPDVGPIHTRPAASDPPPMTPRNGVVIPVCAPILPNHPIRRRISPSMYNEIYTKIILQGRTPSVPINLGSLVSALIEGWKADGEWPPKSAAAPEPSIGRRRTGEGSLKSSVKAVGRVLRLTGAGETSGNRSRDS